MKSLPLKFTQVSVKSPVKKDLVVTCFTISKIMLKITVTYNHAFYSETGQYSINQRDVILRYTTIQKFGGSNCFKEFILLFRKDALN